MVLVVRRGAVTTLEGAGTAAGAAAVACVRGLAATEPFAEDLAAWRPRPGKVCLRARSASEWAAVRALPHVPAGDGEPVVIALPPLRPAARPPVLDRLQAMRSALGEPPAAADPADGRLALTYVLNPRAAMSTGKVVAQVAHAAVEAADSGALEPWIAAGCPGRLLAPGPEAFDALTGGNDLAARVVDAGLTEVPAGTVTVVALPPSAAHALPASLRRGGSPPGA